MKALKLDHQERRHDDEHGWRHLGDRALRLGALLDRAADLDRIPRPACVFSKAEILSESAFTTVAGCVASPIPALIVMVANSVAPPDRRLFKLIVEGCDR